MQKDANFDRATLDRARFFLRTNQPLEDMLKVPALAICLKNVALIRAKIEAKPDVKKLQAGDFD